MQGRRLVPPTAAKVVVAERSKKQESKPKKEKKVAFEEPAKKPQLRKGLSAIDLGTDSDDESQKLEMMRTKSTPTQERTRKNNLARLLSKDIEVLAKRAPKNAADQAKMMNRLHQGLRDLVKDNRKLKDLTRRVSSEEQSAAQPAL
jgi:hypothetical protein